MRHSTAGSWCCYCFIVEEPLLLLVQQVVTAINFTEAITTIALNCC